MDIVKEFRLPDLGEGLTDADLVVWKVQVGDHLDLNQVIAEVETAKATVELPSPYAGTVAELLASSGDTVPVGAPLLRITVSDSDSSNTVSPPAKPDGPGTQQRPQVLSATAPVRRRSADAVPGRPEPRQIPKQSQGEVPPALSCADPTRNPVPDRRQESRASTSPQSRARAPVV